MSERFEMHLGTNYDPAYICSLSDEELAKEIRELGEWDTDLLRDLSWRADIIEEWDEAGTAVRAPSQRKEHHHGKNFHIQPQQQNLP